MTASAEAHVGLVRAVEVDLEGGRCRWLASCSCGWVPAHPNGRRERAERALARHRRTDAGTAAPLAPAEQAPPPREPR